jgi:NADH-quinone oxidoreductase subunit J
MMVEARDEQRALWSAQTKFVLLVLLAVAGITIWAVSLSDVSIASPAKDFSVRALARTLFTTYIFPFEVITILIISSVIGALYIARKEEI